MSEPDLKRDATEGVVAGTDIGVVSGISMLVGGLGLNGLGAGEGLVVVGKTVVGTLLLAGLNLEGTVPALALRYTVGSNSGWRVIGSVNADG